MRRILLIIPILFLTLTASRAFAQSVETFQGTLSGITMNGKHYNDIHGQKFTLTRKSATTGEISGTIQQIGKMPGVLHFTIPVTISTNGTITCKEDAKVGELKMKMGISKSMKCKSFKGTNSNKKIIFTLGVISKMLGKNMVDASFHFESE